VNERKEKRKNESTVFTYEVKEREKEVKKRICSNSSSVFGHRITHTQELIVIVDRVKEKEISIQPRFLYRGKERGK